VPGTGQLPAVTFSSDYFVARERFRLAAREAGCEIESHPISARGPEGQELTIDVALCGGATAARAVVVSSGLHGVEGFLGSAVQLAMLPDVVAQTARAARVVLLHGINPFGFAWLRRCNASNVDLNRNFLLPGQPYSGSPPQYGQLDRLFNPRRPPRRWLPSSAPLLWALLTQGFGTLVCTLPVGQYQFPCGLFYGGDAPAEEHRLVAQHLERWIGSAAEVVHLDLHTGLGRWSKLTLLVDDCRSSPGTALLGQMFAGERLITTLLDDGRPGPRAAYASRGSWNRWCVRHFAQRLYAFATVEAGTYAMWRVATALRAENAAWHHGTCRHDYAWTRRRLAEVFAPAHLRWRQVTLTHALQLVQRACDWASASGSVAARGRLATA
jgi:hypothetical protein